MMKEQNEKNTIINDDHINKLLRLLHLLGYNDEEKPNRKQVGGGQRKKR